MHIGLPPPNPGALGLRISTATYARLLEWLQSEVAVSRAWVFGSRAIGQRRLPVKDGPPDLDVAVEKLAGPEDETTEWFRLRDGIARISADDEPFHLEFDADGSQVHSWRDEGVLIFQRR